MADNRQNQASIIPPEASNDLFKVRPGPIEQPSQLQPSIPPVYAGTNTPTTTKQKQGTGFPPVRSPLA